MVRACEAIQSHRMHVQPSKKHSYKHFNRVTQGNTIYIH